MKQEIYFISDSHFKPIPNHNEGKRRTEFFNLLEFIKSNAGRLYLVGDIFDFWFEYKYVMPKYVFDVIYKMRQLSDSGCEIHLIGGNHDYWLEEFFPQNGITIHKDDIEFEYHNKKFFITHGDGKLNIDPYYPLLKKFIRNEIIIKLFRMIHPDIAFWIADFISRSSRSKAPDSSPELEKLYTAKIKKFSEKKFNQGFDFVITGHYHFPYQFSDGKHTFLNLGDWLEHFTFGKFAQNTLHLEKWEEEQSS
ncbi:MAG: UDP-2,3-diacylglucosamine diphosphatase [Candidatus Marinimicrobia bacterium]|nr:UDP-2,3-diacylglucosamine diphosphatase [Candidatus Neomarinimicrobiota bacterium]